MDRRAQWLRAGAGVLFVALLALLFLRDQAVDRAPSDAGDPTVSTPDVDVPSTTDTPSAPSTVPSETVPSPPEGIEELVCRQFAEPVRLRVLSFNTHRSTGSLASVAEEINEVEPDIVLLQEVDRQMLRTGAVDQAGLLADATGLDGSFSANLSRGRGQYGTLVLSRFEILEEGHVPLVGDRGSEPRGLQWVLVEVDGQPLRVYNTHLDTRPSVRLPQARQVAAVLREDDVPTILGGDLNAWPDSPAVGALSRVLTDTWTASGLGRAATGRGGRKIDYLFVGRGVRPVRSRVALSTASDHHRLWADVRLEPPRRCDDAED